MHTQNEDVMIPVYIRIYNDHYAAKYAEWTVTKHTCIRTHTENITAQSMIVLLHCFGEKRDVCHFHVVFSFVTFVLIFTVYCLLCVILFVQF